MAGVLKELEIGPMCMNKPVPSVSWNFSAHHFASYPISRKIPMASAMR